ncbi:MAG: ribosome small subunit-dependent GTPase A [Myxococcota bacterium]
MLRTEDGLGLTLEDLGFSDAFSRKIKPKDLRRGRPGRIVEAFRKSYLVHTGERIVHAVARGVMYHKASGKEQLPAVGDWVVLDRLDHHGPARVWRMLERQTVLIRKAAGESTAPQVIAANIDTIFIVTSVNQDFNVRRIERYLTLVRDSGATPVLILNKVDLSEDPGPLVREARGLDADLEIFPVSMVTGEGLAALDARISARETIALVGSSGVGKSTLINRLVGDELQTTGAIREADGRGRHTTTTRQLIVTPSGALMIDTPGMRELQPWQAEVGVEQAFERIHELARRCKFRDCKHRDEIGCAVKQAVADGALDAGRLAAYLTLQDELAEQREQQLVAQRAKKRREAAARRWHDEEP